jgi:AcrR family transcriptional regulator
VLELRSHTPKGQRARGRILAAAEGLLVTHGFHGTSVRDIAGAAELPLATVVYHFARKEQLYAAVLGAIADELMAELATVHDADGFVTALVRWTRTRPRRVVLLLRELLDNPARLASASRFPLAPFLARAAELVAGTPGAAVPELAVLHVVGGASYVTAAWPTVERIVGRSRARQLAQRRDAEAIAFARRALGLPGDPPASTGPRTRTRTRASR